MSSVVRGQKEFEAAIKRNPTLLKSEAGKYLQRGTAVVLRQTKEPPWKVGAGGGGAPVLTGNMRQAHRTQVEVDQFLARIYVDTQAAKYAIWVHDGTSRLEARPWLEFALQEKRKEIEKLQNDLLEAILKDLAK